MDASGTKAPSSTVSSLRVARMPITSHVSLIVTPGVLRGRKPWITFGCCGSLVSRPCSPSRVHTGVRLPKALRPVNLYPPGTFSALVADITIEVSLPGSAWPAAKISPLPASSRMNPTDLSPMRQLSAAVPTQ